MPRERRTDWSLDISYTGVWNTVFEGPSCDSCKNHARKIFRMQSQERGIQYRIYGLNDFQLYQVSFDNYGTRMKWRWGNMKSREEMKEMNEIGEHFLEKEKSNEY